VVGHAGGKAAFVAHGHAHALVVQDLLERVEHLGAPAQASRKLGAPTGMIMNSCRSRLLLACAPPLMTFIIGTGICMPPMPPKVAVQRQAGLFGRGAGHGHRNGQHGVGAQAALVVGAVQVDQGLVQEGLLGRVQAQHGLGDLGVDVLHGLEHALAQVAALVAVAQLDGFARAGGGARRHGGAAHGAAFQQHVAFDGGVAAAVQDFAADDVNDCTHGFPFQRFKSNRHRALIQ
jgi:hypothetical protein